MKKNLAIIPARGGSKRIPRKNAKSFLDKPIIAYSIEAALKSGLFDEVMVSTDDAEIAEIAIKYGAKIPFMRSSETANDFATLADVITEVIAEYGKSELFFENVCCILPTAPMITAEDMTNGFAMLSKYDAVMPVVMFSYPIMRSLAMDNEGRVAMKWQEYATTRSQDIAPAYHDSGTFYWIKTDVFNSEKTLFPTNCGGIVVDEIKVQDIDTETDWKLAELKYSMMNEKS